VPLTKAITVTDQWLENLDVGGRRGLTVAAARDGPGRRRHRSAAATVTDHEVPRLDVPVRDTGIPQLPDEQQPLVDDVVIDARGADLDCAGEELGDEEVLALRRDLHDSVRRRGGIPASRSRRRA